MPETLRPEALTFSDLSQEELIAARTAHTAVAHYFMRAKQADALRFEAVRALIHASID